MPSLLTSPRAAVAVLLLNTSQAVFFPTGGLAQTSATPGATPGVGANPGPSANTPAGASESYTQHPRIRALITRMVERHRFDEAMLEELFAKARRTPEVLRLIAPAPPGFKRSWSTYRNRFIDPVRIREGLRFWREHEAVLDRASLRYGVPQEIIVSIIGVETLYGRVTGSFRVIDALTTLAAEEPRRGDYFREELAELLLHLRDSGTDPFSLRGSYAGAMGIPQFMPASIRRFAVDFDGDAVIDLQRSPADSIGSVARFLAEHGWRSGEPTHFPVTIAAQAPIQALIDGGIEPRLKPAQLAEHGLSSPEKLPPEISLALIDLPDGDAPTRYLLGASNFYVITRYNRSSYYAMAVIELADALKTGRNDKPRR